MPGYDNISIFLDKFLLSTLPPLLTLVFVSWCLVTVLLVCWGVFFQLQHHLTATTAQAPDHLLSNATPASPCPLNFVHLFRFPRPLVHTTERLETFEKLCAIPRREIGCLTHLIIHHAQGSRGPARGAGDLVRDVEGRSKENGRMHEPRLFGRRLKAGEISCWGIPSVIKHETGAWGIRNGVEDAVKLAFRRTQRVGHSSNRCTYGCNLCHVHSGRTRCWFVDDRFAKNSPPCCLKRIYPKISLLSPFWVDD